MVSASVPGPPPGVAGGTADGGSLSGAAFWVGVVVGGCVTWVAAREEGRARAAAVVGRCAPTAARMAAGVWDVVQGVAARALPPQAREAAGDAVAGWVESARATWMRDGGPEAVRRVEEAVAHGIGAAEHWTEDALRTHARMERARELEDAIHAYLKHGEPMEFPGVTERTRIRRPAVSGVTKPLYVGHSGLTELLDILREHVDPAEAPLHLDLSSVARNVVCAKARMHLNHHDCTGLPDELRTVRHHIFCEGDSRGEDALVELREDPHVDLTSLLLEDAPGVDWEADITA